MDIQLISKKELLVECGITYGQLYRWKRKKLIPDEWFIRKSTYTGQESFFPREKILKRISDIQKYKNTYSLDELAEILNKDNTPKDEKKINNESLIQKWSDYFKQEIGEDLLNSYPKDEAVYAGVILNDVMNQNILSLSELKELREFLINRGTLKFNAELYINRKLGLAFYFIVEKNSQIILEDNVKTIYSTHIETLFK
ncbi:YhbD family protein [Mammaliicoccus sciuri]|uniref:YhbD family protein n=1 Tax=Mammaliicoccus sciuri TaxID=1296 RepID=UPI0021D2940C|nr:YhbD family protein [Mammaliicoccus sciuri]UXU84021.1 YhbD family protein [Mammaliicoccus sciuri]UXU93868.1 YhbD family protein [Mammaliicoccus sciuri]UXV15818.1 YhbD family protein [Mammaliicoccus sciuri]UXV24078.1 YhbD family protein [Mammaliicoccus sciuri]UXV26861.1 YhbD family protein [Mammaliicoccus sciuri]